MFHRANKNELRTWMLGDIVLFLILAFSSVPLIGTFVENTKKVGSLVFGIIFIGIAALCIFYFVKMIQAFRKYEERMEIQAKKEAEEKAKEEAEEAEKLAKEEEETKKFIEEYQKKVAEAEEERQKEKEAKEEEARKLEKKQNGKAKRRKR